MCVVGVVLVAAAASQIVGSSAPAVLAGSPDYDAEVRDVRTEPSRVRGGCTGDIIVEVRNRSSSQNPYQGEATFDLHYTVRQPNGNESYFGSDDAAFDYNETRRFRIRDYGFDSSGTVEVEVGVYDNAGKQSGWQAAHRFTTDSGRFRVYDPEPEWDASVEDISLSRSVKSGEIADIEVEFRNESSECGSHDGWATFDTRVVVTSPSGKEYSKEWKNVEYEPGEEKTEEFEDFLFDEAGRWRFLAEIYDVRGKESSWDEDHMFDDRSGSYFVEQGEPDFDAEVERIWLDSDVEAGDRTDIRISFENQSRRDGPHDGDAEFDLLLEWHSPSGRKYSEHWDDVKFGYGDDVTKEVENFEFSEEGRWEFRAGIYDNRGYDEGFPSSHMFDDRTWSYTVDAAVPPDDARVADIRVSDSGSAIEADIENLSSAENLLGGSTHLDLHVTVTTPSGQPVVFTEDDFALLHNQTRTYQVAYTFGESGSFAVHARIYSIGRDAAELGRCLQPGHQVRDCTAERCGRPCGRVPGGHSGGRAGPLAAEAEGRRGGNGPGQQWLRQAGRGLRARVPSAKVSIWWMCTTPDTCRRPCLSTWWQAIPRCIRRSSCWQAT